MVRFIEQWCAIARERSTIDSYHHYSTADPLAWYAYTNRINHTAIHEPFSRCGKKPLKTDRTCTAPSTDPRHSTLLIDTMHLFRKLALLLTTKAIMSIMTFLTPARHLGITHLASKIQTIRILLPIGQRTVGIVTFAHTVTI